MVTFLSAIHNGITIIMMFLIDVLINNNIAWMLSVPSSELKYFGLNWLSHCELTKSAALFQCIAEGWASGLGNNHKC